MTFWGELYRRTETHGDTAAECRDVMRALGAAALGEAKVLDAGCGDGRHVNHLRTHGIDVRGVDIDKGALCETTCDFGDMRALPYSDASFDCVYSLRNAALGFEPYEELPRVWSELSRVLKPGGLLFITYSSPRWVREGCITVGSTTEEVAKSPGGILLHRKHGGLEGTLYVRLPTAVEWLGILSAAELELVSLDDASPIAKLTARRLTPRAT